MLRELKAAGWNNYSLFLAATGCWSATSMRRLRRGAGPDGADGRQRPLAGGDGRPVRRHRDSRPDQGFLALDEIFNLEDQLAAASTRSPKTKPHHQQTRTDHEHHRNGPGPPRELAIEVPSWAYGNSGTRFKVFGTPGTPRTVQEKLADAAKVHELTGLAPTVALHIPWDKVDDYAALKEYAAGLGVGLGTINSNTFQDDEYKFGSPDLLRPSPSGAARSTTTSSASTSCTPPAPGT